MQASLPPSLGGAESVVTRKERGEASPASVPASERLNFSNPWQTKCSLGYRAPALVSAAVSRRPTTADRRIPPSRPVPVCVVRGYVFRVLRAFASVLSAASALSACVESHLGRVGMSREW